MTTNWPRQDFPALAARVSVPVQFSVAEHERVWRSDPQTLDADRRACSPSSPRFVINEQAGTRTQLSLSLQRRRLPPRRCCRSSRNVLPRRRTHRRNWRRVDARRIHRTGQPGRPHGAADRRGRLRDDAVGPQGRQPRTVSRTPPRRPRVRLPSWRPPATWSACASSATTTSERCSTARPACWPAWRPAESSPSTAPCIPTPAGRSPRRLPHKVFR